MRARSRTTDGFTLVELAVVIAIVGFLLGGLLIPLATRLDAERIKRAENQVKSARESVVGFALLNDRLPCPDIDGDGIEDTHVVGTDAADEGCSGGAVGGFLPWVTLGVPEVDPWGQRLLYRVTNEFTRESGAASAVDAGLCPVNGGNNECTLELGDDGDINVGTRDLATKAAQPMAANVPALIMSHGPNGFGGVSGEGGVNVAPPAGTDEAENTDGDAQFSLRSRTPLADPCSDTAAPPDLLCEFDDLVEWVPTELLFYRLVAAGRLP